MKKKISVFLLGLCSLVAVSVYAGNYSPVNNDQNVVIEQQYQNQDPSTPVPCDPAPCDTTCTPAPCNPAPCNPAPCDPAPCNPGC